MISVQMRCAMRAALFLLLIVAQTTLRAQSLTTLHSFAYNEGEGPYAGLIQASDGNFYGTTKVGGTYGYGTVFQVTPSGTLATLYSFNPSAGDGYNPYAGLIQASDGNLYGTTVNGGTYNEGTVYRITLSGTFTTLYSFCNTAGDGYNPYAGLIQASDGNLYGTTVNGGSYGYGSVYRITPSGTLTTLYSFDEMYGAPDGINPYAGLIQASDGNLYGTAYYGGTYNGGTVFRITPSGTFTLLYAFDYSAGDGIAAYAGLIQASDGNLYGTTISGGAENTGTVYQITLSGTFTILYSFDYYSDIGDGGFPWTGLIQASDGNLYGTAHAGGANGGYGTVFQITLTGTLTTLHSFDDSDGYNLLGSLIQASDGNLYGTTAQGGAYGVGTVFSFSLPSLPPIHTAANDSYQTNENTTLNVNAANGVLSNDTNGGSGTLTAHLVTPPTDGSLTLNSDGSFTYTPDNGFSGADSFTYFNNNGSANSNTATVTITVNATGNTATSVHVPNKTVVGSGSFYLHARLRQGNAGPRLAGQILSFLVDGTQVGTAVTNAHGRARLAYTPTAPGAYVITVQFAGNAPYLPSSGTGSLVVNVASTSLTVDAASGRPAHHVTLHGALKQTADGLGLAGQAVTVLIDGTAVGSAATASGGKFDFDYQIPSNMAVGSHTIMASYGGDGLDTQSSGSATLTVTH